MLPVKVEGEYVTTTGNEGSTTVNPNTTIADIWAVVPLEEYVLVEGLGKMFLTV
jgi:hypothetical protein